MGEDPPSTSDERIHQVVGAMAGDGLTFEQAKSLLVETRHGPNPYDAATSFTESNLTKTLSKVEVSNGSLQLRSDIGSSVTRKSDSNTRSQSNRWGYYIAPQTSLAGVRVTISGNTSGATTAYLEDSTGSVLTQTSPSGGISPGDTIRLTHNLTAGSSYRVVLDAGGSSWTVGEATYNSSPYSFTSADLNVTSGAGGSSSYQLAAYCFSAITAILPPASSGSATLSWPTPADVYEWDTATFTKTLDSETVDVYVEYSTDGGSSWSKTNSGNPISRNYSLKNDANISASTEVRLSVDISRSSTSNNPSLDSAYRSWYV